MRLCTSLLRTDSSGALVSHQSVTGGFASTLAASALGVTFLGGDVTATTRVAWYARFTAPDSLDGCSGAGSTIASVTGAPAMLTEASPTVDTVASDATPVDLSDAGALLTPDTTDLCAAM